uniref:Uncharacterized protein n=1 Tax=Podoviridae sp. ctRnx2 TaxID=2826555 RepID=A0A8S5QTS2_9CAUD|nr:MAG TPA: hypothetical protein [Podoviridae sp. ctRnx2]
MAGFQTGHTGLIVLPQGHLELIIQLIRLDSGRCFVLQAVVYGLDVLISQRTGIAGSCPGVITPGGQCQQGVTDGQPGHILEETFAHVSIP